MRNEGEPSVEEILDSIKKVIARDSREISRPAGSAPAPVAEAPVSSPSTSMAEAYAAHFADDAPLEIAEPFTQDPYDDEEAVLDLSDIDFIDSAEESFAAHAAQRSNTYSGTSAGYSSAFASVQSSLQAMGAMPPSGTPQAPSAAQAPSLTAATTPASAAPNTAQDDDGLTTESAARSMRESLAALAKVADPAEQQRSVPAGETSLEGLVRDMLRPMLAQWLDENLPDVVERLIKAEIERIMQKRG